jgi:ribosomal protein S6
MAEKKSHSEESELTQANDQSPRLPDGSQIYEVGFHVVPTVQEDGVAAVVEKVRKALGTAEIITEKFPERMTLAYTIERSVQGKVEKYQDAYFGSIKFAAEKSAMPGFQTALRAMPDVLRFIVIITEREDVSSPRHVVFASSRLEGETIKKPDAPVEKKTDVSQEELDKSIDALVSQE